MFLSSIRHSLTRFGIPLILATCAASVAIAQPDPNLPPTGGSVALKAGFLPDPHVKAVTAGGPVKTNLGGVNAFVSKAPSYQLNYTKGAYPLSIHVESKGDTTLLVRLPDGSWLANDDAQGLNPLLKLVKPASGRYDIYVGTYQSAPTPATLHITEFEVIPSKPKTDPPVAVPAGKGRPLYVIAHRINDTDMIADSLKSGANAIEIDLRYDAARKEWIVDHDRIAASSTKFNDWLNAAVKAEKTYGKQWALLFLDIKTAENLAGLHQLIRSKLPANLYLIFSVNTYAKRDELLPVIAKKDPFAGFTIDDSKGDPTAKQVSDFYKLHNVQNGWYGTGITVALPDWQVTPEIRRAVALRDSAKVLKKVYAWTLEKESAVDHYFRNLRVDGVFVNLKWGTGGNHIPMAVRVAKNYGHLATRDTPAFSTYVDPHVYLRLNHEGGYVARFHVRWTVNGKTEEYRSGDKTLGWSVDLKLPRESTNITVRAEAAVFIATWRDIHNGAVTPGTYTVSGTTLDRRWRQDY